MERVRAAANRVGGVLQSGKDALTPWQHTFLAYDPKTQTYTDLGIYANKLAEDLTNAIWARAGAIEGEDKMVKIGVTTAPDAILNAWYLVYHSAVYQNNAPDRALANDDTAAEQGGKTLFPLKGYPNFAIMEYGGKKCLIFIDGPVTAQGAAFGRGLAAVLLKDASVSDELMNFDNQADYINKQGLIQATKYFFYGVAGYTFLHSLSVPGLKSRLYKMERRMEGDVKSDYKAIRNATSTWG